MDMQAVPASTNLHKKLKIAGGQCKFHKIGVFNVKFIWRQKFIAHKLIDQPATVNNQSSLL
jgi:hypothetical protein